MEWPESELLCIKPGDIVQDTTSGWKGMVTAEYRYLNGCLRYEISGADKDGKPAGYIFDEETLKIVSRAKPAPQPKRSGGDRSSTPVSR